MWTLSVVLRLSSAYIAIYSMAPVRQSARQKATGRPAQMTDPSLVDLARQFATAAATGVA